MQADKNVTTFSALGDRIGEQVDEKAHHERLIGAEHDIGLDLGFNGNLPFGGWDAHFFSHNSGNVTQTQLLHLNGLAGGPGPPGPETEAG